MATNLVCNKARVVAYLPSLRSAVRHFRAFSSYDERKPANQHPELDLALTDEGTKWPDSKLGPLNPHDKRFPLPGHVGVHNNTPTVTVSPSPSSYDSDLFTAMLPHERHHTTIQDFLTVRREIEEEEAVRELAADDAGYETEETWLDGLECIAQDCPEMMRKDFASLFPERDIMHGAFTVISISQRTQEDMSAWNPQVDEEREILLEHFIIGAEEICKSLQSDGYWADFIDPSSGRPYLGAYTNATMFETDERYRHFGFEIEDLGCCKVIRHHVWGTHAYVGCLFTNAPLSHPALVEFSKK